MPGYRSLRRSLRAFFALYGPRTRAGNAPPAASEGELLLDLGRENPGSRLLGRFDADEVLERLARAGILAGLARLGYPDPRLRLSCDDPNEHRVCVFADAPTRERLLLEARISLCRYSPGRAVGPIAPDGSFRTLVLNWLVLSDPGRDFSADRPRLPGQEHPGLGLLPNTVAFLRDIARDLPLDAVLNVPLHFHSALFYSRAFRFLDPEAEGRFVAIARAAAGAPLALVSEAIALDCLFDADKGASLPWTPAEQFLALRGPLRAWLRAPAWRAARDRAAAGLRATVDWDLYRSKIAAMGAAGKYP